MAHDHRDSRHQSSHAGHRSGSTVPDIDFEAEHDPNAARRWSNMKLMRARQELAAERAGSDAAKAPPGAAARVDRAANESGAPLPDEVRGRFESSLGADLSGVRVHTGSASAAAAESIGAKAYTTGQDIHFGAGQYDPSSKEGQRLLAHEVAHTVQQGNASTAPLQTKLEISGPRDTHEEEADRAANAMVAGMPASVSPVGTSIVQRKDAGESDEQARLDAAAQPITAKVPEAKAQGKSVPVATDRAPTVEDVFAPQRPSLDGATNEVVMKRIEGLVTAMYERILDPELNTLKGDLSKQRPVPETPFALKLLAWAVEQVTAGTFGFVGRFVGRELFPGAPTTETTVTIGGTDSEPTATTTTKEGPAPAPSWKQQAAEKAGDIAGAQGSAGLKQKMLERPTAAPTPDEPLTVVTTGDLLDEFIKRERMQLYARQSDVLTRLTMTQGRSAPTDIAAPTFVALADKLRDLLESGALVNWFRNKVTMEWLNFMARVSLGPRAEGQTTDLLGANAIGGIESGGVEAQKQWLASDGMVEIHLTVPDSVHSTNGVALQRASIPSSFGAARILKKITGIGSYSLGTLPVYRRVWLQTGDSKLTEAPAFVITPDGAIEADVGNPVLAAIGSQLPQNVGDSSYAVGGRRQGDEARWSPEVTATFCTNGAKLIANLLSSISPEVLK